MSFVNTLQTQSKEDSQKALFDILNGKAMDALSNMQEEIKDKSDDKADASGTAKKQIDQLHAKD